MKIKFTLTTLSAIIALAMMAVSAFSQNNAFSALQNLGGTVNSADADQLPTPAPNGLSLYFFSNRPGGQGGNDIWVSRRATLSAAWGAPQNLGATVNTSLNEAITNISPNGLEMFIQSNRAGGSGGLDIWLSTRTDPNNDFGWTIPVNLGAVINTTFEDSSAIYFVDPSTGAGTLFFSSDRSSVGFADVYQSTRNADGTFNPPSPVNELNSAATEFRLAIRRDGLELFFSSNRLGPATIVAVFTSTRASTSAPWSPPVYVAGISNAGSNSQVALSPDGSILYWVSNRPGGFGGQGDMYSAMRCSLYATSPCSVNRSATADFDGDGRTDLSVFRPSDGVWYILQSGSNTFRAQQFGASGDKIVPGDYDGDGRTDFAVFRQTPQQGIWYVLRSSDNVFQTVQWGLNTDKPVPGDYDGDGRTDIAVYRDGTWWIQQSTGGISVQQFGLSSDIPVTTANVQ